MKKFCKIKLPLINFVSCILCAIYPVLFLFFRNAAEMSFRELQKPFWVTILFAIVVLTLTMCLMRDWNKAGIVSVVFILFCENYSIIANLFTFVFKNMKYWHIVAILLFIFIWSFIFIKTAKKQEIFGTIIGICGLVFGVLILFNTVTAIPSLINKASQNSSKGEEAAETSMEGNRNLPNIYYMIFDECASFNVIRKYYGYDDTSFHDYLEENNFTISEDSYNDSASTYVVLTNCLNLDNVVSDNVELAETSAYRENPELYKVLEEHGYLLRGIGDTEWLNVDSITTGNTFISAQTVYGETAEQLFGEQTVLSPFLEFVGTEDALLIKNAFAMMQSKEIIQPNSSIFTLFYVESPHVPFLFDENGNDVSPSNYHNWDDPQYYLGQYIYITHEIQKCIDNILANDSDSVILITSDHGPRYKEGIPSEEKKNILNSVYFRGMPIDEIKDYSQINTLRIILNKLLKTNYKKVEKVR